MKDWKDHIYFALVEPKDSGNIGASARAIKNMGFQNLCLIRPPSKMADEARWLAHNALDVLESAKIFDSVGDAIKDKSIVVGTTRRTGKNRGMSMQVQQGCKYLCECADENRVAILFGREDKGLLNEEVAACGVLLNIPTSREHRSLNLSQAVLIVAYELLKAGNERRQTTGGKEDLPLMRQSCACPAVLVSQEELSALYSRMTDVLKLLEYLPRGDRDLEAKIMQNLKYFIGRAGLTDWEMRMLYGICSQIEKKTGRQDK
jgi:TrmH family RNA methyltransferase